MPASLSDSTVLKNGVKMPWLGLGVWKMEDGGVVADVVKSAVGLGYRSIDTAAAYRNETGVGQGIRECGVPREDLFITTKVWNSDQGFDSTIAAFESSLDKLGLNYLDLYLIHWPVKGKYIETWRALVKLYEEGRVRAIGVSNFHVHHLQDIIQDSGMAPMVNQLEFHPYLTQKPLLAFCKEHGIQMEAWSPLAQGALVDHPVLNEIGAQYGKTASQVILRWDLQQGVVTIPKSVRASRQQENADVFDFVLSDKDMAAIDALNQDKRMGSDPDNFNF
ncbi:MAG: glyoxal reductase [Paenibacillaceae bacterium]|jgi:diketogulonate reductase-like aldo/keto reductase|nr:glyoxal reductase [Paenibacillaceae bacterium]